MENPLCGVLKKEEIKILKVCINRCLNAFEERVFNCFYLEDPDKDMEYFNNCSLEYHVQIDRTKVKALKKVSTAVTKLLTAKDVLDYIWVENQHNRHHSRPTFFLKKIK